MVQNYDELFFVSLLCKQLSNIQLLKSNTHTERIALVEFDSSHDECLLTQINALKRRGCWVLLITNEEVRARNQHLENLVDDWREIDPKGKKIRGAAVGDALIIRRLMRFLKKVQIEKVIFNTGQGGHVRNACLFSLFRKMEFIGVVHTIRKFQGSFTQRVINWKIKKYLVLGEFLRETVASLAERSRSRSHRSIESFYALDFPKGEVNDEPTDELHIAIIGSVEMRRKDLEGFVSLIEQSEQNVQFHFLGKADSTREDVIELTKKLKEIGSLDRVKFSENRLDNVTIDKILRKSSAVLPLVHPDTPSSVEYFRNQIPGAMSVALGYKLPLLLHRSFEQIEELNPASIYYSLDDFSEALTQLQSEGKSIRERMKQRTEYSSEHQYKKYLDFIFG